MNIASTATYSNKINILKLTTKKIYTSILLYTLAYFINTIFYFYSYISGISWKICKKKGAWLFPNFIILSHVTF